MSNKLSETNVSDMKRWLDGYGVIKHSLETQNRVAKMYDTLKAQGSLGDGVPFYSLMIAADYIANAAMWLAVNQTYADRIYLDGRDLNANDFKNDPQGHLGSSLNMIPAYVGYMLVNALTGITRSWVMGQGHAVAAIDCVNLLLNNMTEAHASRYSLTEEGLTRFARDFYSYKLNKDGRQESPLGSHVNPHTAGGHLEGGYLGFASVQYVHMPLPGESLVAFLSDGAFEEQRGADYAPRWWRADDTGKVMPIMIANGRRIDQRTTLSQQGCIIKFAAQLKSHNFDPIIFDGRDPAAFAWAIWEQESRLSTYIRESDSKIKYPIPIPYGIAVAPKGAGFYNEGTNFAHNLPLVDNPYKNMTAAILFNKYAKNLFVPFDELQEKISLFQMHHVTDRIKEREHPIAQRNVILKSIPEIPFCKINKQNNDPKSWEMISPMDAIDEGYLSFVKSNSHLRPRVGNPDEILSNRMDDTLKALKIRAINPEEGSEESETGKIITMLNEEAVAGAAFGNKGGINIIVTYEAFGSKMFGGARQEIIFSKHMKNIGKAAKWLSVPLVLTSNTWENGKNELSHQDPSMSESMLSETSDISRVLFPADYNTAAQMLCELYQTHGEIWTIVVPKRKTPVFFSAEESRYILINGGIRISWAGYEPDSSKICLIAVGAYQLCEILKASASLKNNSIPHTVTYLMEPARFREPRNKGELEQMATESIRREIVPSNICHVVIVTHTRPELMLGTLQPLWSGCTVKALGFINEGGTLNSTGMQFVNGCSWAHILRECAKQLGINEEQLLNDKIRQALDGNLSPENVIT